MVSGHALPLRLWSDCRAPASAQVKPRWSLEVDAQGLPTLRPSVWLTGGCRSHFFLRKGKIIWV